jgi:hypothetical protein
MRKRSPERELRDTALTQEHAAEIAASAREAYDEYLAATELWRAARLTAVVCLQEGAATLYRFARDGWPT